MTSIDLSNDEAAFLLNHPFTPDSIRAKVRRAVNRWGSVNDDNTDEPEMMPVRNSDGSISYQ